MQQNRIPLYVGGLVGLAAVLYLAGVSLATLLPFAIFLACPIMMIFMMKGMGGRGGTVASDTEDHTGHGCEHDRTGKTGPSARR